MSSLILRKICSGAAMLLFVALTADAAFAQTAIRSHGGGGGRAMVGRRPNVTAARGVTLPTFGTQPGGGGSGVINRSVMSAGGKGFNGGGGSNPRSSSAPARVATGGFLGPINPPKRIDGFREDGTTHGGTSSLHTLR